MCAVQHELTATPVETAPPRLPLALKLVAGVCIATGLFSLLEIVLSIVQQSFHFNLGIQGIFIGWGLLRRRKFFRLFALLEVWVSLIGFPLFALYLWTLSEVPTFPLLGRQIVALPYWIAAIACLVAWLIAVWELWVLRRPDVKAVFGVKGISPSPAGRGN